MMLCGIFPFKFWAQFSHFSSFTIPWSCRCVSDLQTMNDITDIDMVSAEKENVPVFSYSTIKSTIFNILPVYFTRKRRRSDNCDREGGDGGHGVKKRKPTSLENKPQRSNIHKSIMPMPSNQIDREDNVNQYVQYLEYMSHRESFD